MNKKNQYEQTIKQLGRVIVLDKDLTLGEVVVLLDLMENTGKTGISILTGNNNRKARKLLHQKG